MYEHEGKVDLVYDMKRTSRDCTCWYSAFRVALAPPPPVPAPSRPAVVANVISGGYALRLHNAFAAASAMVTKCSGNAVLAAVVVIPSTVFVFVFVVVVVVVVVVVADAIVGAAPGYSSGTEMDMGHIHPSRSNRISNCPVLGTAFTIRPAGAAVVVVVG